MKKLLIVCLLTAWAVVPGAAQQPSAWQYSLDLSGKALATYPGDVVMRGPGHNMQSTIGQGSPAVTSLDVEANVSTKLRSPYSGQNAISAQIAAGTGGNNNAVAGYFAAEGKSGASSIIWGINPLTLLDPGYAGAGALSAEIDVAQNTGADFINGSGKYQNGLLLASGGGYKPTLAINIGATVGPTNAWRVGLNLSANSITDEAIYDASSASFGLYDSGNHQYAVDLNPSTNSHAAIRVPNGTNGKIVARNQAGNSDFNLLYLDHSNNIELGANTTTNIINANEPMQLQATILFHGSAPRLSACGTSPSADSHATTSSGTITGGRSNTGCTIVFAATFRAWNHCRVTSETADSSFGYLYTKSAITIVAKSNSNYKWDYDCDGY